MRTLVIISLTVLHLLRTEAHKDKRVNQLLNALEDLKEMRRNHELTGVADPAVVPSHRELLNGALAEAPGSLLTPIVVKHPTVTEPLLPESMPAGLLADVLAKLPEGVKIAIPRNLGSVLDEMGNNPNPDALPRHEDKTKIGKKYSNSLFNFNSILPKLPKQIAEPVYPGVRLITLPKRLAEAGPKLVQRAGLERRPDKPIMRSQMQRLNKKMLRSGQPGRGVGKKVARSRGTGRGHLRSGTPKAKRIATEVGNQITQLRESNQKKNRFSKLKEQLKTMLAPAHQQIQSTLKQNVASKVQKLALSQPLNKKKKEKSNNKKAKKGNKKQKKSLREPGNGSRDPNDGLRVENQAAYMVYGNEENIGMPSGKKNAPLRFQSSSFRRSNENLLAQLLQELANRNLANRIEKQKKAKLRRPQVILLGTSDVINKVANQGVLKDLLSNSIVQDQDSVDDNSAEILDDDHTKPKQNASIHEWRRQRDFDIRKDLYKGSYGNSPNSNELSTSTGCPTPSSSSSASAEETIERNEGNPYTIWKNKYKQNWMWNHFMDGDHMNINPLGPEFQNQGPSGPALFFGRKWWYFNQDDYKPF